MGQMDALVFRDVATGPRVETVDHDGPKPGEALVRMKASGICGSDIRVIGGTSNVTFLPAVLGHEGSGIVEAVGPGVSEIGPGSRVAIGMFAPCGLCAPCSRGDLHLCESSARMDRIRGLMPDGGSRLHAGGEDLFAFVGCGTLAEYAVIPVSQLVPVPDHVPLEAAAVASCGVVTGLGAVLNIAKPDPGSSALVLGCGGVGLSIIQGCRLAGVTRIVAVDQVPTRLRLAQQVGATEVVDASQEDVEASVRRLVPRGFDTAFEAAGKTDLVTLAFSLVRHGGMCVAAASYPPDSQLTIDSQALFWDRRLRGCVAGNSSPQRDLARAMDLYASGQLNLDMLTDSCWNLSNVDDAIAAMKAGDVARAIIEFT